MDKGYAAWAARWRVPFGFAVGVAYLILSQPTARLLVAGSGVALVGLLLRACAAGFLEKNQSLSTGGPYAYTRNPLYLGSALMGVGFALAGRSWTMALALVGLFVLVYWPVMRREERFLRQKFGEVYDIYSKKSPFFLPTPRPALACEEKFRWERYRRNREYEAALGYAVGIFLLAFKAWLR